MAISQMQKLSLILPKEKLDEVLVSLQVLQQVQVRDLTVDEEWQLAFASNEVTPSKALDEESGLAGDEALQALVKRQQRLDGAIHQLKRFLPQLKTFEKLRQKPKEKSFSQVEVQSRESFEQQTLTKVQNLLKEHRLLIEQLENLLQEKDSLLPWQGLATTPRALKRLKHVLAVVGTIPNTASNEYFHALEQSTELDYEKVFQTETAYGVILFSPHQAHIEQLLQDLSFKPWEYERECLPSERIAQIDESVKTYQEKQATIEADLRQSQEILEALESELESTVNRYTREGLKKHIATSQYLVALEGWVETAHLDALKQALDRQYGDMVYISDRDVTEADWDEVPIQLKNNAFVEPFETVTEMYALPKYYEKDPTPILAPLYFVFFGMMVADIGYGLVVVLATWAALNLFHLNKGMQRFMRFFELLGISTTLWGLVYGSFFGFELPVKLISTTTDVMTILVLSVAFGFITLLIGLFLGGQQKVKMKDYASAYNDGFAWCLILLGVLLLVIGMFVPSLAFLGTIGKWLAIINAIGIVLVSVVSQKSLAGLGTGLYNLYNASGYVGDLVSFTRLMALGLSGASIGSAFNLIVNLLPTAGRLTIGIVLFILLHLVNLLLSLLSGYVHGARLIFVELFGKFYEGGGKAFKPLKPAETSMTIIKETHLEEN